MNIPGYLAAKTDKLINVRLKGALRNYYRHPLVIFAAREYFRYILKRLRRYRPLLGSVAVLCVTSRCQCGCPHCGVSGRKQNQDKDPDAGEVTRLVDEAAVAGASWVDFFGGEPLLAAGLPGHIRHAKSRGLSVMLETNGILLDEEMVLRLKEAGVDKIKVSLDSPVEAAHDRLRGVPGAYRKAVDALKLCGKHGIAHSISTYATKENLRNGELRRLVQMARDLGTGINIVAPVRAGRWEKRDEVILSREEYRLLKAFPNEEPPFCFAGAAGLFHVSTAGEVQPCAFMPLSFGNVKNEPLAGIVTRMWGSDLFAEMEGCVECPLNSERFMSAMMKAPGPCPKVLK